jgi:hypothetical protein
MFNRQSALRPGVEQSAKSRSATPSRSLISCRLGYSRGTHDLPHIERFVRSAEQQAQHRLLRLAEQHRYQFVRTPSRTQHGGNRTQIGCIVQSCDCSGFSSSSDRNDGRAARGCRQCGHEHCESRCQSHSMGVTGVDEAADSLKQRLDAHGVKCLFTRVDGFTTVTKLRVLS